MPTKFNKTSLITSIIALIIFLFAAFAFDKQVVILGYILLLIGLVFCFLAIFNNKRSRYLNSKNKIYNTKKNKNK